MGQRFEVKAKGLSGTRYRAEIYDPNYSAGVTSLQGADQFILFAGGNRDRVGFTPVWGQEVRLNVVTNQDLSGFFEGLGDTEAEMRVYDEDQGKEVWRGYVLPDLFTDEPQTYLPGIEIRATDGLKLLGDPATQLDSFLDFFKDAEAFVSFKDALVDATTQLFSDPLDVVIGTDLYPANIGLASDEDPLQNTGPFQASYYDESESSWFTVSEVVEQICQTQGLVVQQALIEGQLSWLIIHPQTLSSSTKVWRYRPLGTLKSGYPKQVDLTLSLSPDVVKSSTRDYIEKTSKVTITHDHKPISNLVKEGSFENSGPWTIDSDPTGFGEFWASRKKLSDVQGTGGLPPQTRDNTWIVRFSNYIGSISGSEFEFPVSQDGIQLTATPNDSYIRLSQSFLQDTSIFGGADEFRVRLNVGSYWLTEFTSDVTLTQNKAQPSIFVEPIDFAIPKGTRLPITVKPSNLDNEDDHFAQGNITLEEAASEGDSELIGTPSLPVESGKHRVHYVGWQSSQSSVRLAYFSPQIERLIPVPIQAPLTLNDGTRISGTGKLEYGYKFSGQRNNVRTQGFVDNVKLTVQVGQSQLDQSEYTATTPNQNGQTREATVRVLSGPTDVNRRRIVAETDDFVPFDDTPLFYTDGYNGGTEYQLGTLIAQDWLRYLREPLERRQVTFFNRGNIPYVSGHELVSYDGKEWIVAQKSSDEYAGEVELTLIEWNDFGTS